MNTTNGYGFRAIVISDLFGLASIFARCFSAEPWNEAWTFESSLNRLKLFSSAPTFRGAIATEGDNIVGMAMGQIEGWVDGSLIVLQEMCVVPEHQNSGIGTALLQFMLESVSRTDHAVASYLLTDAESMAESFYVRRGFKRSETKIVLGRGLLPSAG